MVRMLLGEDGGWGENCILLKMWLRLEKRSDEELYFCLETLGEMSKLRVQ